MMEAVIASEAKQSMEQQERVDCFVASLLAKMVWTAPDGISVPDW
ncbi:MAG TPA: hypothetical protein VGZ92_00810 [Bradyrhizobium sp.]|jgi:hypothetical protein|nr:hypothetical protein [Bradyrhizobium sp.]